MFHHSSLHYTKVSLILALACLMAGLLAACGGTSNSGPVTLTFWSWVPNLQKAVDLFNKSHPNIQVKLENVGAGGNEYTKLTTALKAKKGAPDVVQLTYEVLPTYELPGYLVDLSQYGANDIKNDFVDWAWAQVTQGSKVYAIPQDSGPMGLIYRKDIFDQYGLAVPTTWDQYAQEAKQLHQANPKIYMTDFPSSDGSWFNAFLWQAGSRPFKINGTTVTIHMDDAPALQVANYWGDLVKSGAVSTGQDWTNDWYAGLSNGTIATWLTAAWAPTDLAGSAAGTAGKWRVAPLPQWTGGAQVSSNWGGSTDAVTAQGKHPKEAAEFAMWLNDNQDSASLLTKQLYLFPTQKSVLNDPSFVSPMDFYGGQEVNSIFVQSSSQVDKTFQWSPFQDYAYSQLENQLADAVSGKISFEQAMHNTQQAVVSYAQSQGFTVNS
jgi:multiple sugar transport system substrate-binding protein